MQIHKLLASSYFKIGITFLLFLLTVFVLSQKINLVTADLGRHLKNGEYFFQHKTPIRTNYYSYTLPEKATVNHHWFSGVLFYTVHQISGFYGLSLFYVFLYCLALAIVFYIAYIKSGFFPALLSFLILLPLFAHRREIRPEVFSFLGIALYLLIFETKKFNKISNWAYGGLIAYQLFWSNSHIYAFFGPLIAGLYLLSSILIKKIKTERKLVIYCLVSFLCLVITPFGITGLWQSLAIMNQYGYRLAENMSLPFMISWTAGADWIYLYSLVLVIICFGIVGFKIIKTKKIKVLDILILGMGLSAFYMNRNLPLFALIALIINADILSKIIARVKYKNMNIIALLIMALTLVFLGKFKLLSRNTGMGLQEGIERSAQFFKTNNLRGPIFNNYDNGGYLIYELFPQETVFVDNRPEAYNKEFFDSIYNPALADEAIWKELDDKFHFNTIYFYRHDMTDNAQAFLYRRTQDHDWLPVYIDNWTLMLVRNNEANKNVISKFGLPREMFSSR